MIVSTAARGEGKLARSPARLAPPAEDAGRPARVAGARRWPKAVAGSFGGSKNTDRHPGTAEAIIRLPLPRGFAARAGAHWHGRQDTRTRPRAHGWPIAHAIG